MLKTSNSLLFSSFVVGVIVGCHDNVCEGLDEVDGEIEGFCDMLGMDDAFTDGLLDGSCDKLGVDDGLNDSDGSCDELGVDDGQEFPNSSEA